MQRRDFIRLSMMAGGALLVQANVSATVTENFDIVFEPNLLVKIEKDNTITFSLSKMELGQGVSTAFPMIFADELGADLDKMKIIRPDYNKKFGHTLQGITGGSNSTQSCWQPLREAAAMVREVLIQAAAETWQVEKDSCYADNSKIICRSTGKELFFGDLIERAVKLGPAKEFKLKDHADFKYIGKPIGDFRTSLITAGKEKYGIDIFLEGMLYAVIARSPVHLGRIKSFNDSETKKIEGVVNTIKIDQIVKPVSVGVPGWDFSYPYTVEEGVAVVANSTWAALKGQKALLIEWNEGENEKANNESLAHTIGSVTESEMKTCVSRGDALNVLKSNNKILSGTYEIPFIPHCCMEPNNATASVKGNECEIWVGTQFPKRCVEEISAVLKIPIENVKCHPLPMGGAFGRKWEADYPLEAALISQAMQKPVKLLWTREDDLKHDYLHSMQRDVHLAALNEQNQILAWKTDQYNYFKFPAGESWNPYSWSIENYLYRKVDLQAPVETGAWRSVEVHKDTFTQESFFDEMAHAASWDPLEFRLQQLKKTMYVPGSEPQAEKWLMERELEREIARQVLELAAEKSGWGTKRNLGIALGKFGSACAQVAEIEIENGQLRIKKITVAIHCGLVVNPSFVENQLQGAVVFALQALMNGGVDIENGKVKQSNFNDYKMIRINETPSIEVHFIKSNDAPTGVGETGVPPLAPSVMNAIYALTGKRMRRTPLQKNELL